MSRSKWCIPAWKSRRLSPVNAVVGIKPLPGGQECTARSFLVTPLRQRMLEDRQIRQYSPTTIRIYMHVVAEFARH